MVTACFGFALDAANFPVDPIDARSGGDATFSPRCGAVAAAVQGIIRRVVDYRGKSHH
jgi:hypothetical protein